MMKQYYRILLLLLLTACIVGGNASAETGHYNSAEHVYYHDDAENYACLPGFTAICMVTYVDLTSAVLTSNDSEGKVFEVCLLHKEYGKLIYTNDLYCLWKKPNGVYMYNFRSQGCKFEDPYTKLLDCDRHLARVIENRAYQNR